MIDTHAFDPGDHAIVEADHRCHDCGRLRVEHDKPGITESEVIERLQRENEQLRTVADAALGVLNTAEHCDYDGRGMPSATKVRYTRVVMLEEALARWSPTPTNPPE